MINLTYENQGTSTFLVYKLGENDIIDTMTMGMISNNKIYGVLPFIYSQMDSEKLFKYNTSSRTSLKQYFAGVVNKKRLLTVFSSLATAIIGAEEYMLEPNMFILDLEYIYVNVTNSEVSLVCLPIVNEKETHVDMGRFFKDIVFSVQFDQTENCDYVANLISFLNGNINFSLGDFKSAVDSLIADTKPQTAGQPKAESSSPARQVMSPPQGVHIQQSMPVQQQNPVEQQPKSGAAEVNPSNLHPPYLPPKGVITNPNMNNANMMQPPVKPQVKEEGKPEKKRGWLFGGRKEKKNKEKNKEKKKNEKQMKSPFAIPGSNEPVSPVMPQQQRPNMPPPMQQNAQVNMQQNFQVNMQPNMQPNIQPNLQRNFGETTVLGMSNAGETTVLSQNEVNSSNSPYLLRLKNGEKIYINKPVFRIGKEKSYVDYFVADNTAISRSHADIITKNGEYFILDNNSTNHTYINNKMIQSVVETKITHGTRVRLANEEFEFKLY